MMIANRALRLIAVAAILGIGSSAIVRASELPPSPIKLIVPYPPGGGTDAVARLVASSLGTALGVSVIVENRSGGATVPATDAVAKAPADGGTLLFVTDTFGINDAANKRLPYDTMKDFLPVAKLVDLPMVLSGSSLRTKWKSMDELVKYARSNPGKVTFGSLGSSSPHELTMAYFAKRQGITILNVPYRGTTPALQDLVAGQIDVTFTNVAASEQFASDGKIYRIAVTSPKRAVGAQDVETVREQGYPDLTLLTWFGIVAPAGTPPALVERYYREIEKISQSSQMQKLVASIGGEVAVSGPDGFLEFIKNDIARYRKMIEETGIKVE